MKVRNIILLILISNNYSYAQEDENKSFKIEVGIPVINQFIEKTYTYNGTSGNNTLGGFGGINISGTLNDKVKLSLGWSNMDRNLIGSGASNATFIEKNFVNTISISRLIAKRRYELDIGISYLYVYERTSFNATANQLGLQFSSFDHYLGLKFGAKYNLFGSFGTFINYHLTPYRLNNESALGYAHLISIGIAFHLFKI